MDVPENLGSEMEAIIVISDSDDDDEEKHKMKKKLKTTHIPHKEEEAEGVLENMSNPVTAEASPVKEEHSTNEPEMVENPMFCDIDLTQGEPEEMGESDSLIQRLTKKLAQAHSEKEKESLKTLIQKRKEKLKGGQSQPQINKPKEERKFSMQSTGEVFGIKDTGSGQHNFWSIKSTPSKSSATYISNFIDKEGERVRAENRNKADKHEKDLKETINNMETEIRNKEKARKGFSYQMDHNSQTIKKTAQTDPRLKPLHGSFISQNQDSKSNRHMDRQGQKQNTRNPRLKSAEKTVEERSREAGLDCKLGEDNKGFAMLKKMGFREGGGLGREGREGMKEPVGIAVRRGREGFGS